jgi:hypothetical protein
MLPQAVAATATAAAAAAVIAAAAAAAALQLARRRAITCCYTVRGDRGAIYPYIIGGEGGKLLPADLRPAISYQMIVSGRVVLPAVLQD